MDVLNVQLGNPAVDSQVKADTFNVRIRHTETSEHDVFEYKQNNHVCRSLI